MYCNDCQASELLPVRRLRMQTRQAFLSCVQRAVLRVAMRIEPSYSSNFERLDKETGEGDLIRCLRPPQHFREGHGIGSM